ncbi:protein FAM161B isoform X1 [Xenopus laevis]|nr:protein FAM161B isoform X1 [Xenopus laevis]OCT65144.1 hypothetical protein XELAEV_18041383mg [Xenopus laevis]
MDWKNETDGTDLFSRVARLMDYVDQEEDNYNSEQDLQEKLQALKIRNGLYLQELNSIYQAYSKPSQTSKDFALEELFANNETCNRVPKPLKAFDDVEQKVRKSKGATKDNDFEVTVPRPFQMTLREADRKDKLKLNGFLGTVDTTIDAESLEDQECLKQFRAQPVPSKVFMPLYDELMEEHEAKKKAHILKRKEFLLATQKPFSFLAKEEERKKKTISRSETAPPGKQQQRRTNSDSYRTILDPALSDKLREAELLRKINSQIRAKVMLENSAAPIPLNSRERDPQTSTLLKTKQEHLSYLQQNLTFQPHIKTAVPDFQKLYKMFQKESLMNQKVKEPTRNKPFTLHTSRRSEQRKPKQTNKEASSDLKTPSRSISSVDLSSLSPNTLPVYITDSTNRRKSAIRSSLEEKHYEDTERAEWSKKQKKKSQVMQRSLSRRAKALDPHLSLADTIKDKLNYNRQSDRRRAKEYTEELEQMKKRVKERPYLFEHVSKRNAVNEVEQKFKSTMQEAGITEEFLQHKGGVHENAIEKESIQEKTWEEHSHDL